jgi:hypothetical protein
MCNVDASLFDSYHIDDHHKDEYVT